MATGVRPNTHLARRAGMDVSQGVLVSNHLAASAEGVYAGGDVAEHNGVLYGTWAASQYQGSIAGMNAAGHRHALQERASVEYPQGARAGPGEHRLCSSPRMAVT